MKEVNLNKVEALVNTMFSILVSYLRQLSLKKLTTHPFLKDFFKYQINVLVKGEMALLMNIKTYRKMKL